MSTRECVAEGKITSFNLPVFLLVKFTIARKRVGSNWARSFTTKVRNEFTGKTDFSICQPWWGLG